MCNSMVMIARARAFYGLVIAEWSGIPGAFIHRLISYSYSFDITFLHSFEGSLSHSLPTTLVSSVAF